MAYEDVISFAQTVLEGTTTMQSDAQSLMTQLPMCEHDMDFTPVQHFVDSIRSWMPSVASYSASAADALDPVTDPALWGTAQRLVALVTALQPYVDILIPHVGQLDEAAVISDLAGQAQAAAVELVADAGTAMAEAAVREATEAAGE
jgi:hypothetical protein